MWFFKLNNIGLFSLGSNHKYNKKSPQNEGLIRKSKVI